METIGRAYPHLQGSFKRALMGFDSWGFRKRMEGSSSVYGVLGGSWDLVSKVSKVISTLIGVISSYKYSYPYSNPGY